MAPPEARRNTRHSDTPPPLIDSTDLSRKRPRSTSKENKPGAQRGWSEKRRLVALEPSKPAVFHVTAAGLNSLGGPWVGAPAFSGSEEALYRWVAEPALWARIVMGDIEESPRIQQRLGQLHAAMHDALDASGFILWRSFPPIDKRLTVTLRQKGVAVDGRGTVMRRDAQHCVVLAHRRRVLAHPHQHRAQVVAHVGIQRSAAHAFAAHLDGSCGGHGRVVRHQRAHKIVP